MDLLVVNGKIVNAHGTRMADIAVKNGRISNIASNIRAPAGTRTVDAAGKLVFPGGIDVHVHFNLPVGNIFSEGWEDSTKAAACGGVTSVIDFSSQEKGGSLKESVHLRLQEAQGKAAIDFGLHAGITDWNRDTRREMNELIQNEGISSFKMFMIYRERGLMSDDAAIFEAMEATAQNGAMIMLHAESETVLNLLVNRYHTSEMMKKYGAYCHALSRPDYTEYEAVQRAALWAEATGGRAYIVHVSSGKSAKIIKEARSRGVNIHGETCPPYLLLDESVFQRQDGHLFATCPQIKKKSDSRELLKALKDNSLQVIATDNCTFNRSQKDGWGGDFTKIPYGVPGVELMIPVMYSYLVGKKRMSLRKFVSLTAENPARLFGMYPQKGTISVGSDADMVIFDPRKQVTVNHENLATRCDWSPFQGMKLLGYPEKTILRGEIVAENGKYTGSPGIGRYIRRKTGENNP